MIGGMSMMKDLIDRREAIKALGERPIVWAGSDYGFGARNQYDKDLLAIETVPSVHPNGPDNLVKDSPGLVKDLVNDCISRRAAIDAMFAKMPGLTFSDVLQILNELPSAQPECAKDFVMLKVIDLNGRPYYSIIYLENGNEFEGYSSYNLKVISEYLKRYFGFAQPERQRGEWIDYTEDGYVECPFCHNATNCDGNKDELHFCFSCGADMREVSE